MTEFSNNSGIGASCWYKIDFKKKQFLLLPMEYGCLFIAYLYNYYLFFSWKGLFLLFQNKKTLECHTGRHYKE